MNKTLEALLRGYVLFDVNGKKFIRYNAALAERKSTHGDVEFSGFNIYLMRWLCFFKRVTNMSEKAHG